MKDSIELLRHIDELHTTDMGELRIARNTGCAPANAVEFCREIITDCDAVITRRGKNFYAVCGGIEITVNASSFTIITAHKHRENTDN